MDTSDDIQPESDNEQSFGNFHRLRAGNAHVKRYTSSGKSDENAVVVRVLIYSTVRR